MRRNSRRLLAIAAPMVVAGLTVHANSAIETDLRLAQAGTPEIHVRAEDGAWRSVTETPARFNFLIEASATRGTIRDVAYGIPGVHVDENGAISAGGTAARHVEFEPTNTLQRWVRLDVRGDALPVYGPAAIAACNQLMAEGASTDIEHRTEIRARARAAMSVSPDGWQVFASAPVVDAVTIDVTIGVVCEAESPPTRTSDVTASGNGGRHG